MIEVEKKFRLKKGQQARIKKLAKFISRKNLIDIYFDDSNRSLTANDIWLRKRGNIFELKIPAISKFAGKRVSSYQEIYGVDKITGKIKTKVPKEKLYPAFKNKWLFAFLQNKNNAQKVFL